ncbi:glycosyltransferase (DUF604) [Tasmannia lanceolata]|uniref:glycosyltransferase (DUF604) n=1 Tax=Tasmannia lanceolata TaxID=3420 RepID=UPI004062AA9E
MACPTPCKTLISTPLKNLLILSSLCLIFLLLSRNPIPTLTCIRKIPDPHISPQTTLHHVIFGIASSAKSWPKRNEYVRLWWKPQYMRGYVFLDRTPYDTHSLRNPNLPPIRISSDTSRFPYTFKGGLRSAIRVSRIVSEIVALNLSDVRWIVLGDDDTVFFAENLVMTLSKYDHDLWFYVGGISESVEQNSKYSFGMAFGGGGFAVSYPLARVLARVLDSCLVRYSHLYGSDARVFSCLAELGVGLTRELGFHQIDIRGDLFGMLSAHPLTPLVSLHHLDYVEPIFPNMNRTQALERLFEAVKVDHDRILQQTVCYDRSHSRTISVSWGYAVQVFEGNQLLPDLLSLQRTFTPWKRGRDVSSSQYMFSTRELPKDRCNGPAIFFLESVSSDVYGIRSNYKKHVVRNCLLRSENNLEQINVFSKKLNLEIGQLQAPRRHCCDVLPSSRDKVIEIFIRICKGEELISMHL